jgi:phosphopantetheinyl transferase
LEQIDSVKAAGDLMKQGFSLQESFFRLWTKKEAVYKLNSLIDITDKEKIRLSYHKNNDFMLCVAAIQKDDVSWEKVEFENC